MRVWIQNRYPEGLIIPEGPAAMWLQVDNSGDPEYDNFVALVKEQNFDPPVPNVLDPLSYIIKLQQKFGAGLVFYLIGTYYGPGIKTYNTAVDYVAFKYQHMPSLPAGATKVVSCQDDEHPVYDPLLTKHYYPDGFNYLGYWLASDPSTFVSIPQ